MRPANTTSEPHSTSLVVGTLPEELEAPDSTAEGPARGTTAPEEGPGGLEVELHPDLVEVLGLTGALPEWSKTQGENETH